jgi:hypothetical protein
MEKPVYNGFMVVTSGSIKETMSKNIQEISKSDLVGMKGIGLNSFFQKNWGLLIHDFWNQMEIAELAQGVLKQRAKWQHFPVLYEYYALGCPLYAYRCAENQDKYFDMVQKYDLLIAESFPRLETEMKGIFETLQYPENIRKKKYFGGPGFVIQNQKSTHEPHFDQDEAVLISKARFPKERVMFTLVAMVQKPTRGGRLMVWDREPQAEDTEQSLKEFCEITPPYFVDYQEGDLLILDGMKLHLIEPCQGERITAVLHYLKSPLGPWEYWF